MSTQERIELLKAVAECAPMEARYIEETTQYVMFFLCRNPMRCCSLFLDDDGDFSNGQAIIAMLDAMEKAGWWVELSNIVGVGGYDCTVTVVGRMVSLGGATRAEAVSKAFVAVFGGGK